MRPLIPRLVVFATLICGSFLALGARQSLAHAVIESTEPAANSVLSKAPNSISLNFDEPVDTALGWMRVFDSDGERVVTANLGRGEGDDWVRVAMPELENGGYLVVWRVMSADGHAVEGAFGFQIGESSLPVGNEVVSSVVGSQGDNPLPGRVAGTGRYISYGAFALLFGLFVLNIASRRLRVSILGAIGAVSVLVVLLMTGPNTLGGSLADAFDVSLLADTMSTRSGTMMAARILFFVAIAIVGSRMPRRMLGLILVLLAGTFAAGGHSGSESPVLIAVLVTTVHVTAVSIWVGGILAVLVNGITSNVDSGVQRFSEIMNFVLPAVVLSGVLTAARNLGGLSELFDSAYGKITFSKFLLVGAMGVIAMIVRRKLQSATQPKKVLVTEAVFGLVAFVLAAVLAVTPPINASGSVFQRTAVEAGLVANITVDPVGTGSNEIHILFSPPGGALSRVGDVKIRYSLPERSVPNLDATVSEASPNHWIGVLNFPYTGTWKVEVLAKPTPSDTVRFVFEVAIGG